MRVIFCLDQQGKILYTNRRADNFGAPVFYPGNGLSFTRLFASHYQPHLLKGLYQQQERKTFATQAGQAGFNVELRKGISAQPASCKASPQLPASSPASPQLPAALQNSLEHMSDALLTLDNDWRYTYLNQKAATILGYAPEELLGKSIWQVFPGLVNSPFYKAAHHALETQQYTELTDYAEPLGRWLERRMHPGPEGLMVFFSDVSARKEEEIRQSQIQRQLQNIQDAVDASSVVSFIDLQGCITWANDNFCRVSGYSLHELLGKKHGVLENTFLPARESANILSTINNGQIWKGEVQNLTKAGKTLWAQTTIVPMRDVAGEIFQHTVFCQEITERKATEKALMESEKLYRTLIENHSDAVFLTDWQGNIVNINQQAEKVISLKRQELEGKNFLQFLPAEDRHKISTALPMLLQGKNLQFKTVIEHFTAPFTAALSLVPVLQGDGQGYFFISLKDISSQVNYERDLKLLNDITLSLSTSDTLKEGVDLVLAQLCAYGDFQYAECWMPLYEQPIIRMKSAWWTNDRFRPMQIASQDRTFDIRTDKPELLNNKDYFFSGNLGEYTSFRRASIAAAAGLQSLLSIPVIYRNKLLAIINLFSTTLKERPSVDPDRLKLLLNKLGGELERRKSNEELDRFFALSPELMSIIGFDGYTKKYNAAFQELFGYSQEEINTMVIHDYVHPDDLPGVNEAWQKIIQGQSQRNIELRYRSKSGHYRWLSCSTQSVVEENLFYLTARDITSQKQQYTELEQIRLAIENTTDAIGMASDMEQAIYLNKAFDKLLGWTMNELNAIGWTKMFVNPQLPYDIVAIITETGSWEGDIEMYHCNGTILDINLRANAVLNPDGSPRYLIGIYRDITEQKRQLQELELIKLAVENTSDAIGIAANIEQALYLNKGFYKLLGWTLEELNPKGWTSTFVDPQTPVVLIETIMQKGSWEGDIEMYHRNGSILDINMRANAVLNPDGSPRYLIGVCRDITEQKKAQLELARLSTAIKHSINEVYIITPEIGHFSYVNARALNNLGYTNSEINTLRPLKINPEYASFHYRRMFALLISGRRKALHFQTYHTRKDGSRYPVEIHLSPFQFKQEHAIMASVIDITERLKAEEELRISNERYRLVTLATNDAIWDLDLLKQIVYYGEGYRTLFGHSFGNSFAGMEAWADNIHPEDAETVLGNVYDVLITNSKEWVIEYRFRCANGSYKYIKDRGYVIYNKVGEAIRMTGAISDITNQKENELLLQKFNAELERKVEEKTASLAYALRIMRQGELARIETEKVLQQSLQEKEVLIKEIHHRVKNNMAIISGLLSLQARQAKNDELKSILKDSQSRIKSMALIHELLYQNQNLARINFKNYIYELVAGISDSFHSLDRDITIRIEAEAAELNIVHAVPCALILNELITNCYKYAFAENARGCIFIDYKKENETHVLSVADNGTGLPEDFDARKTKSLGMQLIGSLVRQIGGEMIIDTSAGAKFVFIWKE